MTPETCNSPDTSSNMSGSNSDQAVNVAPGELAFEAARDTYAEVISWGGEPDDALASALAAYHTNFILPPNVAEIVDKLKPTYDICPFCRRDPYHYVDNGVGMEAVAVTCCERGIALLQYGDEELQADVALREQAASLILSQSSTIASAREVIGQLLPAAEKVLEGLHARIDAAENSAVPVFYGISDLHDAIGAAREWKGR